MLTRVLTNSIFNRLLCKAIQSPFRDNLVLLYCATRSNTLVLDPEDYYSARLINHFAYQRKFYLSFFLNIIFVGAYLLNTLNGAY